MISRHFLVPWRLSGDRVVNPVLEALETLKDSVRGGAEYRYAPARKQDGLPSRPMCVATVRAADMRDIPVEQLADVVELGAPTAVEQEIRSLQPGFVGFRSKLAASRGTFSDDFTGTDGQNLGDRTGWTYVTGANADSAQILSNTLTAFRATRALYTCTDQGASNYTQAKFLDSGNHSSCFVATRLVDTSNFVGIRLVGTSGTVGLRFSRNVANSITDMVSTGYQAGIWMRCEAEGDDGRWYLGGTDATPGSWVQEGTTQDISAVEATETSQGVTTSGGSAAVEWIDDFEAGALGGGEPAAVVGSGLTTGLKLGRQRLVA